jgi:hypothetical protein
MLRDHGRHGLRHIRQFRVMNSISILKIKENRRLFASANFLRTSQNHLLLSSKDSFIVILFRLGSAQTVPSSGHVPASTHHHTGPQILAHYQIFRQASTKVY